jgi:hypothetical protein
MYRDPISVFAAAAEALELGDWFRAADLCDPVSLLAFRHVMINSVTPPDIPVQLTIDDIRIIMPDAPIAVLEYMASANPQEHSQLELQLFEVESVEMVHRMSPREVLASALKRQANPLHLMDDFDARLAIRGSMARSLAIGAVMEGEGVAHVLYRVVPREEIAAFQPAGWFYELTTEEQERARPVRLHGASVRYDVSAAARRNVGRRCRSASQVGNADVRRRLVKTSRPISDYNVRSYAIGGVLARSKV